MAGFLRGLLLRFAWALRLASAPCSRAIALVPILRIGFWLDFVCVFLDLCLDKACATVLRLLVQREVQNGGRGAGISGVGNWRTEQDVQCDEMLESLRRSFSA